MSRRHREPKQTSNVMHIQRRTVKLYRPTLIKITVSMQKQVAQLSPRDRAAGWVSFGQSGRRYSADIISHIYGIKMFLSFYHNSRVWQTDGHLAHVYTAAVHLHRGKNALDQRCLRRIQRSILSRPHQQAEVRCQTLYLAASKLVSLTRLRIFGHLARAPSSCDIVLCGLYCMVCWRSTSLWADDDEILEPKTR